ncbi:MAG TPA: hypothetical protein VGH67_13395 [Solirubrobacteraceae bacterium]
MILLIATEQATFHALIAVLVFGLVIGVFGHLAGSRTLILTSILIIGGVSVYFAFGFSHVT